MVIRVFHRDKPDRLMPIISRDARLVVWPGVGAITANMNYVRLEPGEANVPHVHAQSEDTIFVLSGKGTVQDFDNGLRQAFKAGQAIHVPVGVKHAVAADLNEAVVSAGGPCPADFALLRAVGAWPKED